MKYAQIRKMDISNGEGVGVSLFVQGCHFHCDECFNKETWDFNGGKFWTPDVENEFIKLIGQPHVQRVSILGGEPLADENVLCISNLLCRIRSTYHKSKMIWLYTGYRVKDMLDFYKQKTESDYHRIWAISNCDVVVDGRYDKTKRDPSLLFRGSSNQKIYRINGLEVIEDEKFIQNKN